MAETFNVVDDVNGDVTIDADIQEHGIYLHLIHQDGRELKMFLRPYESVTLARKILKEMWV